MAIIKSKALQNSDTSELKNKLQELRLELIKLSSQRASKSVSNPGRMGEIRRSIAKIHTFINQKNRKEAKGNTHTKTKTKTK